MLNVSEKAKMITDRFFLAVATLTANKRIRGLQTFTRAHDINYGNMNTLMHNRYRRQIKPEYLAYLCEDYGISPEWLLLGTGEMFIRKCAKNG